MLKNETQQNTDGEAQLNAVESEGENTQPTQAQPAAPNGKKQKEKKTVWQHIQYWILINIGTLCVAAGEATTVTTFRTGLCLKITT